MIGKEGSVSMDDLNGINGLNDEVLPPDFNEESESESLSDNVKIISPTRLVLKRFFRSKLSVVGLCIMIGLLLFCFLGPIFVGWGEDEVDSNPGAVIYTPMEKKFKGADGKEYSVYYVSEYQQQQNIYAPCFSSSTDADGNTRYHVLGTDDKGMDVLARLMYGGRISLSLSVLTVLVNTMLGVILGGIAGFFGKWVDMLIMRIVDIFMCVPTMPILLIASSMIDSWDVSQDFRIYYLMIILTIFGWSGVARLVRGQILALREQEYMIAAEASGLPVSRKIIKHLVPNILPQLIVSMTLGLGGIILTEATMSYLNLGIPMPKAAWGSMINRATSDEIMENYPNMWIPAGVCIILAVLAFNFVGDGLRDAFDPKMKR